MSFLHTIHNNKFQLIQKIKVKNKTMQVLKEFMGTTHSSIKGTIHESNPDAITEKFNKLDYITMCYIYLYKRCCV